jgi:protein-disulfide isomerase
VPLFALATVGIHLDGQLLGDAVTSPITLGILLGYVIGKPVGVVAATWLATRVTGLRRTLSWPVILGGGTVAAIPFTVSLLIAGIAFEGQQLEEAKLGVLGAAILAALLSWIVFRVIARLPTQMRARQLADTADELLDLSDEVDPERDHIRGPHSAPVTLVEYGDYECPYCAAAAPVLRHVVEDSGGEVRLIFRNFPIADRHPYALTAALAAEAAGSQGAFWEMHELLFARQDRLDDAALRAYAEELGLDAGLVVGEAAQAFGDKVEADFAAGLEAGVGGTPTVFIDGRLWSGRVEAGALRRAIGSAPSGSNGSTADGGGDPGPRRQSRWARGLRRAQREPLPEDPEQDDPGDRCDY